MRESRKADSDKMIGSFLSRVFVMILGYAYPAYECYKTVDMNKPEIEQLRFWCQYWILVALMTVFERIGDFFISWLPMYGEAKLAFFLYLWYPKTKGTKYIYDTFFRPVVAKHETDIDRRILELRARAGDVFILYWQKSFSYGQSRFFEILQYVATQSRSDSQPKIERLTQSSQSNPQASTDSTPADTKTGAKNSSEAQAMQVDSAKKGDSKEEGTASEEESPMDEAIRRTRARLRKRAAIGSGTN